MGRSKSKSKSSKKDQPTRLITEESCGLEPLGNQVILLLLSCSLLLLSLVEPFLISFTEYTILLPVGMHRLKYAFLIRI